MPSRTLLDRKSTRLNSSHGSISYAVFCLKKKNQLICGDARDMRGVADSSVALVVTSSPYFAGKYYELELSAEHIPATYLEFFFFNDTATTEIYTLSLHDALPIFARIFSNWPVFPAVRLVTFCLISSDRKSTRLNSSHGSISYAVFCLKKKKIIDDGTISRLEENVYRWTSADPSIRWFNQNVLGFFFNDTATTEIYTLSLHDALPI